jgi:hypothetical protein
MPRSYAQPVAHPEIPIRTPAFPGCIEPAHKSNTAGWCPQIFGSETSKAPPASRVVLLPAAVTPGRVRTRQAALRALLSAPILQARRGPPQPWRRTSPPRRRANQPAPWKAGAAGGLVRGIRLGTRRNGSQVMLTLRIRPIRLNVSLTEPWDPLPGSPTLPDPRCLSPVQLIQAPHGATGVGCVVVVVAAEKLSVASMHLIKGSQIYRYRSSWPWRACRTGFNAAVFAVGDALHFGRQEPGWHV